MLVIAHLSDTHLDLSPETRQRTERVVGYLDELTRPPDVVLVTGDIADHAAPDEYAEAAKLFAGGPPTLMLPGNHDARAALHAGLGALAGGDPGWPEHRHHRVRTVAGAVFVLVDVTIPGADEGELTAGTADWLGRVLAAVPAGTPTFVSWHHPPEPLHHLGDRWPMATGAAEVGEVLAGSGRVTALLVGHAHTAAATTFAGLPVLVAPGVASTVRLPFEPEPPGHPLVDRTASPGFAFHVLADGRLVTHFRYLP